MKKAAFLAAMALAAAAPLAASAAPPSGQAAPDGESLRLAQKLVAAVNPHDLMVDVNLRGWEATVKQVMAAAPPVQKLEAQYPGVSEAGIDGARPLARQYCEQFVAKAAESKALIFAAGMSQAELLDAIAFYGSPTGQRLVRSYTSKTDVQEMGRRMTEQAQETGRPHVTSEMAADLQKKTIQAVAGDITAADELALMRFSQKPAAAKLTTLSAEADRQLLAEINKPHPEWEATQSAAINNAMRAYVDARKKP